MTSPEQSDSMSLREQLDEAYDEHDPDREEGVTEEDLAAEATGDITAEEESADEPVQPADDVADTEQPDTDLAESGDGDGEEPEAALDTEPSEVTEPVPDAWRPEAREVWDQVPAAARAEISRREQEIQTKLGELSDRSNVANQFSEAVKPFEQTIAIEAGGDPIAATRNLMGIATRLRFGTPPEKAQIVSQIISQYGVGIEELDDALAGSPPGAPTPSPSPQAGPVPPAAMPYSDPRVDQMWNQQQSDERQRVEDFIDSKEFGKDVRNDMADLMELAGRRGERLTLDQAYDRAIGMRQDIQSVLAQRGATPQPSSGLAPTAGEARPPRESIRRKKRAASSISGSPPGDTSKSVENMTLREQLEHSMDEVASR